MMKSPILEKVKEKTVKINRFLKITKHSRKKVRLFDFLREHQSLLRERAFYDE